MELGEKIRQARLEAGLSQRQACEGYMTRNMLSLIENGSAKPSMDTLQHLAGVLGKPISWFLEEAAVTSPNQELMEQARALWDAGNSEAIRELMRQYVAPDPVFDREAALLRFLSNLALAEKALGEHRLPFARSLLKACDQEKSTYITAPLRMRRIHLGQRAEERVGMLPLDGYLLAEASREKDPKRAAHLLEAMRLRSEEAELLLGKAYMGLKLWKQAVIHLKAAEVLPDAWPALEESYKALGDFEKAYAYAVKQRGDEG